VKPVFRSIRESAVSQIVFNVGSRLLRRVVEIPSRGLPRPGGRDSFDKTHGTNTSGVVWATNLRSRNFPRGIRYEPCAPRLCEWAIENAGIDPKEFCFVDVGCGKGRALLVASQYPFVELIGVEYAPKLSRIAEQNLRCCGIKKFRIASVDASEFTYPSANTFAFFYHPFSDVSLFDAVLDRIKLATLGQKLVIAYLGKGRYFAARHGWLTPYGENGDLILYRSYAPE